MSIELSRSRCTSSPLAAFLDDQFGRTRSDDAIAEDGLRAGVEVGPRLVPDRCQNWREASHWPVPPCDFDHLSPLDTRHEPLEVLLEFPNRNGNCLRHV